jgi:predicted MFS family arabinose efflux permease
MTQRPPAVRRAPTPTWPLYTVAFLANLTMGARVLAVPLFAGHLGQSSSTIGLLYATFAGVSALTNLPAGFLIDRIGSRKILYVGLAFTCGGQILALSTSIPLLFASQVLSGAAWGTAQLGVVTGALESSEPHRLGRVLGLVMVSIQGALMAGPAVAGVLLSALGFAGVFLVFAVPPLAGAALLLLTVGGRPPKSAHQAARMRSLDLIRHPGMLPAIVLAASVGVVWGTFQAYFAIFAANGIHLTTIEVGSLLAIAGLTNALSRLPAGRVLDRFTGPILLGAAGVAGFGVGFLALPHLQGFWPIAATLILSMAVLGLAQVAMNLEAAMLGTSAGRGRSLALVGSAFSLASGIGPALLAPLMSGSFVAGFSAAGLMGAAIAGVAMLMRRKDPTPVSPNGFQGAPTAEPTDL